MPRGLHARLCHAFLVRVKMQQKTDAQTHKGKKQKITHKDQITRVQMRRDRDEMR